MSENDEDETSEEEPSPADVFEAAVIRKSDSDDEAPDGIIHGKDIRPTDDN